MLIKQLEKEQFEFDNVVIVKNEEDNKWEVKHNDKVICDIFKTKEEAELWAIKISKEVHFLQYSKIIWDDIKEEKLYEEIVRRSRELNLYLNDNSIVRSILFVVDLPLFTAPVHKSPFSVLLSDIYMLSKRQKGNKIAGPHELTALLDKNFVLNVLSDKDFVKPNGRYEKFEFWAEMFEISVINKIEKGCSDEIFEDIKKDLLKEEEDMFIFLVKEVAKKNNKYIICDSLSEAVEKISKIVYKEAWTPKKFSGNDIVKRISKQKELVSSNLQGFILSHNDNCLNNGILDINQPATILYSSEDSNLLTFEEIAMTIYGKSLTYVEIKNEDNQL